MEPKHFNGPTIMSTAEAAAKELGCGVDDLDYEMIINEDEKEFSDEENPIEIVVYGVLEISNNEAEHKSSFPKKDPTTLTEEEFDNIADQTTETIRQILSYFDAETSEIDEYMGEDGEIILDVVGSELGYLIGRHGKTLDAFQLLVTSIMNRKIGYKVPLVVDVEGYKNKRKEKIENLAIASAEKAIKRDSDVRLRPMNPYERRLIHIALKDNPKVETFSEGKDPERYIIIRPL